MNTVKVNKTSLIRDFQRSFFRETGLKVSVHVQRMPVKHRGGLSSIDRAVSSIYGPVLAEGLKTKDTSRTMRDLRILFVLVACKHNYSSSAIGKHLQRDRSTILYLKNTGQGLLETDGNIQAQFKALFNASSDEGIL